MKKTIFLFLLLKLFVTVPVGAIEYDGVEFFISEEEERLGVYTLKLKGIPFSYTYSLIKENGVRYYPIFEFIKAINLKNYSYKNGILEITFGDQSDIRKFDLKKMENSQYIYEDNDFYIREDIFTEYFFEVIRVDDKNFTIQAKPNFILPTELSNILEENIKKLKKEMSKDEILYKGERNLFDLGNLRIQLGQDFYRGNNSTGKSRNWSGNLEYSGSLLFGNFITDYDLKDKKIGDVELTYHSLKEGYELNFGAYGEKREKGFSFRKEKGYTQNGRNYTIEERVPIGSRVELLYNQFPIDIKTEENGRVKFENNLIKTGRDFILRIYEQDGKITDRLIKINEDFNQQIKGEFGYDLYFREDKESRKNKADFNLFYGYTDKLTVGLSLLTEPYKYRDKYIYSKEIGTEFIYSDSIKNNPFTVSYEFIKSLNDEQDSNGRFREKYRNRLMFDGQFNKLDINFEEYLNGRYYDEQREIYIDVDYDIIDNLSFTISGEQIKYYGNRKDKRKRDYYYGIEYSNSWKNLLVSYRIENKKVNEIRHDLDFYYTGFRDFTVRFNNQLNEKSKYTSAITINNTRWLDNLNLSMGFKYLEDSRIEWLVEFTIRFDNWLEFGSTIEKNGDKKVFVELDRVLSLKNPTKNMNSLENMNVHAIAFFDMNDNNIYDKDEELLEGVEVALGQEKLVTDENGKAIFYGIPSYANYELIATSQRPSHNTEGTKVLVRGLGSSQVKAYIPVKPMISLVGNMEFSKDESIYNEVEVILYKIGDEEHKKKIYIDSTGEFYLPDLTSGKYILEARYIGFDYRIKKYEKELNLVYTTENRGENYSHILLEEEER